MRVRTKFYNIIDLKYVNDYICDTRSRSQIIGAIYLHIPMHSPVDRAAVERCKITDTSQRHAEMILYRNAIDFISILC